MKLSDLMYATLPGQARELSVASQLEEGSPAAVYLRQRDVGPGAEHPPHVSHLPRPHILRPVLPVAELLLVSDGVDSKLMASPVKSENLRRDRG